MMNCDNCDELGMSGNSKVCGFLLRGGETVYVRNGKINDPCPKVVWDRYNQLIALGRIPEGE
jgi:hypothetical protein